MKKRQYVHKITLYKINSFEPDVKSKKKLFYKNKSYLEGLYSLQIFYELKGEMLPIDIIKHLKSFLYI